MMNGHRPRQLRCTPSTILLMVACVDTKQGKLNGKFLLYEFVFFVGCVDGVQFVCTRIVPVLHIDTFMHSILAPPSFLDGLLTPIWTESVNFLA